MPAEQPQSQTKTIEIDGIGQFEVPASYDDSQIKQHIQTMRQKNPHIFQQQGNQPSSSPSKAPPTYYPGQWRDALSTATISAPEGIGDDKLSDEQYHNIDWGKRQMDAVGRMAGRAKTWLGIGKPERGSGTLAADVLGGPVTGPLDVMHGAGEAGQGHPVKGINEIIRGGLKTITPAAAVANPGFMAESVPFFGAAKGGEAVTSLFTDDPDYQELGGNVAALGLKPAMTAGRAVANRASESPIVSRILGYGTPATAGYAALHGNLPLAAKIVTGGLAAKGGIELGKRLPEFDVPSLSRESPPIVRGSTMTSPAMRKYMGVGPEESGPPKLGGRMGVQEDTLGPPEASPSGPVESDVDMVTRRGPGEAPKEATPPDKVKQAAGERVKEAKARKPRTPKVSKPAPGIESKATLDVGEGEILPPEYDAFDEGKGHGIYDPTEPSPNVSEVIEGKPSPKELPASTTPNESSPQLTATEGNRPGANYSSDDLAKFKEKNGIKDEPRQWVGETTEKINKAQTPEEHEQAIDDAIKAEEGTGEKTVESTMPKERNLATLKATAQKLFPGKTIDSLTEEEYKRVENEAYGKTTQTVSGVQKPSAEQLATLSDTQLRHAAYSAGLDVVEGETAKTLIPKLIAAMEGKEAPKPVEEPDMEEQLRKSLEMIKQRKKK